MDGYEFTSEVPVGRADFNPLNDIAIFMGPVLTNHRMVSAEKFRALAAAGAVLLDVRGDGEYMAEHICGALDVPVDSIEERSLALDGTRVVAVYGGDGGNAEGAVAADKLETMSFGRVVVLDGGIEAWKRAGYCTECSGPAADRR